MHVHTLPDCPLCNGKGESFFADKEREYCQCITCFLVYVPARYFLEPDDEKSHYDLHENSPDDPGYRQFLTRLFEPMLFRVSPGARGLDFGCGPGPTLSVMFEEAGFSMAVFDLFYANNPGVFDHSYDFITTSEVVEHLHHPREELDRLWQCLRPGGSLGIMTKRVLDKAAFSRWHYKNDPTHVCFFHQDTFRWLADAWGAGVDFPCSDVVIFRKPPHK